MLDMGFLPDIKRILSTLPAKRQSLLFSATYSDEIRGLAKQLLTNPVSIEVSQRNSATDTVTHLVYKVESAAKRDLLTHLIKSRDMRQVLVFCNTKIGANRLAYKLDKDGVGAAAIHSDRTQGERMLALADFKEGKTRVLVATDIAARGLDIEQLPFVVNFDLPGSPEDYVHRIGRTGRAGMTGEAISLMCDEERDDLAAIEKLLKIKLPVQEPGQFERERVSAPRGGSRRPAGRPEGRSEGRPQPRRDEHRRDEHRPAPSRNAASSADPLFSKPYTPSSESTQAFAPPTTPGRGPKKQIAALFLPPAPAEKQDA
jgi:ATP-dependent RNA helicase RhlE